MTSFRVLVVDDEPSMRAVLKSLLEQEGIEVVGSESSLGAMRQLEDGWFDVVLSDVRMPGEDGMTLLRKVQEHCPEVPVVMLTAHGSVGLAVDAMKQGARDFLLKPFDRDALIATLRRVVDESATRRSAPPKLGCGSALVGDAPAFIELLKLAERVASRDTTVLLRGESGTGKELLAREIHSKSPRGHAPLIAVNCAAVPETLLESELFGYKKGAFTGANHDKPGLVALAAGGTLFLDEIGDVPLSLQAKLLRLLQEREYTPVGGRQPEHADVRFIAATHRNLEEMAAQDRFRQDLYYRLSVVPLTVPPLRERPADIATLAQHFLEGFAEDRCALDAAAIELLKAHSWPGNVRELQNAMERLAVFCDAPVASAEAVRQHVLSAPAVVSGSALLDVPEDDSTMDTQRVVAEARAVHEALEKTGHNKTRAARLLGVSRRTLYNKIEEFRRRGVPWA